MKPLLFLTALFLLGRAYSQDENIALGYSLLQTGEWEQALKLSEKVIKGKNKSNPWAWKYRFEALMQCPKQLAESSYPKSGEAFFQLLSESAVNLRKSDSAQVVAKSIFPFIDSTYKAYQQIGKRYFKQADSLNAFKTNVIELENINGREQYKLAYLYFDNAVSISRVFNSLDTVNIQNAAVAAQRAELTNEAMYYYIMLINSGHGQADLYNAAIKLARKTGQMGQAKEMVFQARKKFPEELTFVKSELNIFILEGNYVECLGLLPIIERTDSLDGAYFRNKGRILDNIAHQNIPNTSELKAIENHNRFLQEAILAYEKSVKLEPDDFESLTDMAGLFFNEGAESYNQAIAKDYVSWKSWVDGKYFEANEYFKKSLDWFEKARAISPDNSLVNKSTKRIKEKLVEYENRIKK